MLSSTSNSMIRRNFSRDRALGFNQFTRMVTPNRNLDLFENLRPTSLQPAISNSEDLLKSEKFRKVLSQRIQHSESDSDQSVKYYRFSPFTVSESSLKDQQEPLINLRLINYLYSGEILIKISSNDNIVFKFSNVKDNTVISKVKVSYNKNHAEEIAILSFIFLNLPDFFSVIEKESNQSYITSNISLCSISAIDIHPESAFDCKDLLTGLDNNKKTDEVVDRIEEIQSELLPKNLNFISDQSTSFKNTSSSAVIISDELCLNSKLEEVFSEHFLPEEKLTFEDLQNFASTQNYSFSVKSERLSENEWSFCFKIGFDEEDSLSSGQFEIKADSEASAFGLAKSQYIKKQFPKLYNSYMKNLSDDLDLSKEIKAIKIFETPPELNDFCIERRSRIRDFKKHCEISLREPADFSLIGLETPYKVFQSILRNLGLNFSSEVKVSNASNENFQVRISIDEKKFCELEVETLKKNMAVDIAALLIISQELPDLFAKIMGRLTE